MTARTRKWVHAGLVALVGVMTDVAAQLTTGTFSSTRAVIVGLVIGGFARVMGAMLAAVAATEVMPPEGPPDEPGPG